MFIKRRKLGTVYEKSPWQKLQKWAADNVTKIFYSIGVCILWLAVLYVISGVVNFVGSQVAEAWSKDQSLDVIYNHPYMAPVKIVGAVLLVLYVFRDVRKR